MKERITTLPATSRNPAICLLLLGIMVGSGCSSGDDDSDPVIDPIAQDDAETVPNDDADATPPDAVEATTLTGTWEYCTGQNNRTIYVFEGDRFEMYVATFENEDCSGEISQGPGSPSASEPYISGIFVLGDTVTADTGVEARELDFSVRNVLGNDATVPLDTYTIVSFNSPTELVMPYARGNTPETRPLNLDFDAVYVRTD